MNIFIGFGYNNDDKWIKDLIFPLVTAFDGKVITGEDMHGQIISEEVKDRIRKSDGLLAFLTPRKRLESGEYTSHRWVYDELSTSLANGIPAVEIRDSKVDSQGGLPGNRQIILFDSDNKAALLVELATVLAAWRKNIKARRLLLLPEDVAKDARKHIRTETLECTYQFLIADKESPVYKARPIPVGQGLCIDIYKIPSDESMVQIVLKGPDFEWSSGYEYVHMFPIKLQKS